MSRATPALVVFDHRMKWKTRSCIRSECHHRSHTSQHEANSSHVTDHMDDCGFSQNRFFLLFFAKHTIKTQLVLQQRVLFLCDLNTVSEDFPLFKKEKRRHRAVRNSWEVGHGLNKRYRNQYWLRVMTVCSPTRQCTVTVFTSCRQHVHHLSPA